MGKQKKNKRTKSKSRIAKRIIIFIIILLIASVGAFLYQSHKNGGGLTGMLATVAGHNEQTKKNLGEFKCLILGISTDQDGVSLTDTIMVASYNPKSQKATLLSIPRDTYTGVNASKATAYEKINALYSRKQRANETLDAVNKITGLDIQYYVVVRTEALIKLVDVIGGVKFNVPINMDYDDEGQKLHIHLKAGEQLLDGDKAEQVVRFRHNNNGTSYPEEYGDNDVGRTRTQRDFVMQVIKQTAKPGNIFKIGEILDVAEKNVETNVDFNVIKDYIPYAVEFNTENTLTGTLPGTNTNRNQSGTWIFIPDKKETQKLVQEMFFDRDITEELGSEEENSISKKDIKIEIVNGTGDSELLKDAVEQLETVGYKVSKTGTTNEIERTMIINKNELKEIVLTNIKDTVGVGEISNKTIENSKQDITIILGKDYK